MPADVVPRKYKKKQKRNRADMQHNEGCTCAAHGRPPPIPATLSPPKRELFVHTCRGAPKRRARTDQSRFPPHQPNRQAPTECRATTRAPPVPSCSLAGDLSRVDLGPCAHVPGGVA